MSNLGQTLKNVDLVMLVPNPHYIHEIQSVRDAFTDDNSLAGPQNQPHCFLSQFVRLVDVASKSKNLDYVSYRVFLITDNACILDLISQIKLDFTQSS